MIATAGEVMVVQFMHPGREHVPPADRPVIGWNVREHRRKFLRTAGRCLDNGGSIRSKRVSFWAEWEAQSRVVERHPDLSGPMPRFVQEPILAVPQGMPVRQNTDPYVFGGSFLYSNCRQCTAQLRPTRLQRMPPGSLVLFGAHLDGRFVLDTLFVVASRTPYTIEPSVDLDEEVSAAFRVATRRDLGAAHQQRTSPWPDGTAVPRHRPPGARAPTNVQLCPGACGWGSILPTGAAPVPVREPRPGPGFQDRDRHARGGAHRVGRGRCTGLQPGSPTRSRTGRT